MRFAIRHEIKNRIRVHLPMDHMSFREADTLEYYLRSFEEVTEVRVYERTADAAVRFTGERSRIIAIFRDFSFDDVQVPHYNYVGDSVLGNYSHLGAGAVCSNLKSDGKNVVIHVNGANIETGMRKVGAFIRRRKIV